MILESVGQGVEGEDDLGLAIGLDLLVPLVRGSKGAAEHGRREAVGLLKVEEGDVVSSTGKINSIVPGLANVGSVAIAALGLVRLRDVAAEDNVCESVSRNR